LIAACAVSTGARARFFSKLAVNAEPSIHMIVVKALAVGPKAGYLLFRLAAHVVFGQRCVPGLRFAHMSN
jgi:hypothetical protein